MALIVGNRPDALPARTTALAGPASVGSGIGGSVGPAPAPTVTAGALLWLPADGDGCFGAGFVDRAGDVVAGAGVVFVAVGDGVGVGVMTATEAPAAGGVHGSSVGTLAVAVSATEVSPDGAGS